MCDNLCPVCNEREVEPDLEDRCFRCFMEREFDEYRHGDTDDPSKD